MTRAFINLRCTDGRFISKSKTQYERNDVASISNHVALCYFVVTIKKLWHLLT